MAANPSPKAEMSSTPGGRSDERTARRTGSRPAYLRVVSQDDDQLGTLPMRHARARRILDCIVASIGIVLTLPLWIVLAVLIKLTSRGPIFHTQTRVGLDTRKTGSGEKDPRRRADLGGRPFTIYKFRTMHVAAEHGTGAVWATPNDPRVTGVGRFLRRYRLDELPQLVNVLKGEMSVVGPRPERPTIFAELRDSIPQYPLRQRARPGITGLAQVRQQYDSCLEDVQRKVEFDLTYIREQSLWQDLRIMLETIPVILLRKGGW